MGEKSEMGQKVNMPDEEASNASQPNKQPNKESIIKSDSMGSSNTEKNIKPSKRFRDFLIGSEIIDSELDDEKPSINRSRNKSQENKVNNKNNTQTESHEFNISQELMKFKTYRHLHSNKEQIIKTCGGLLGAIFIISGFLYLFGGSTRLADNVIFGERAVLSTFSILIGILIISGLFGRHLLTGTFLKNIQSELEIVEEAPSTRKSTNEKKKSVQEMEKQKDNIQEKDKK